MINVNFEIKQNIKLSELTTFKLGGKCEGFIDCQTIPQLKDALEYLKKYNLKYILIGEGSNILACDKGIDSYVVRFKSDSPIIEKKGNDLTVISSTLLDDLALYAAQNGLEGINFASGIYGTVGGAIYGNAGAFGKQIGDVVRSVKIFDKKLNEITLNKKGLRFSYRDSIFKKTNNIILSALISLKKGNKNVLLKEREELLRLRKTKHPDLNNHPCAGSFFKNIVSKTNPQNRISAGWFLEQAGAKFLENKGAKVFDKHSNILIKSKKNCKSQDVLSLAFKMRQKVKEKFKIELMPEVILLGEFENNPFI